MAKLYVALLHYPVHDREGRVVTSSVTNIDVHDIARSCRTFGVTRFYVVTPVAALRGLVRRIMRHWSHGPGLTHNPNRSDALALVDLQPSLEGAEIDIERSSGELPVLIASSAKPAAAESGGALQGIGFEELRAVLTSDGPPHLLLLGTSWGLADSVVERCRAVLEPIRGPGAYNHLSVRAAAAILLDRLLGTR